MTALRFGRSTSQSPYNSSDTVRYLLFINSSWACSNLAILPMDSPIPDDKSFHRFSSLSFITFSENDWKLSSPSLTPVQSDADWTEESTADTSQERPEELRSLWHEIGVTFSIAMSQILTVWPRITLLLCVTDHSRSTLCLDSL